MGGATADGIKTPISLFNGTTKEVDCRPSDAIALAVRVNLLILVAKKLADYESAWITSP